MISDTAKNLASQGMIDHSIKTWKNSESLFFNLFPSLTQAGERDNINHIDFEFDSFDGRIDVKGLKFSHLKGFVLLELINVQGKIGWCHQNSKADFFAFQFPEGFYMASKNDILQLLRGLLPEFNPSPERRSKHNNYEALLYTYCGRVGRKDIFTYIRKEDLNKIPSCFYPIVYDEQ